MVIAIKTQEIKILKTDFKTEPKTFLASYPLVFLLKNFIKTTKLKIPDKENAMGNPKTAKFLIPFNLKIPEKNSENKFGRPNIHTNPKLIKIFKPILVKLIKTGVLVSCRE